MRSLLLPLTLPLASACATRPAPSPQCRALVDKIVLCDPTVRGVPRSTLERQCVPSRLHCAELDTSTPEGCNRFIGCLYDG